MKWLWLLLSVFIVTLQVRLWVGEGSFAQVWVLQKQIDEQIAANQLLADRNALLDAEVLDLKSGNEAIEERARNHLGMIHKGESFYLLIDNK
ncbi:cell division protein FtsB [Alkalimarinus alittae]|uniref:Cell division protein FtsB n=1 Tax=Alkalimarinus alittae TaxID=2961619 RepID=A0ABY6N5F8_9ALTE|nr:cell division protein FtsB [Alkalimarinus alittae]UZE97361.1 cell division protein FtsB [Alkalimarinus alittae]